MPEISCKRRRQASQILISDVVKRVDDEDAEQKEKETIKLRHIDELQAFEANREKICDAVSQGKSKSRF